MSNSPPAFKMLSRDPIKQHCRGATIQQLFNPNSPFAGETFVLEDLQDGCMFNGVKSLFKINLEQDERSLGLVTLMKIFKSPGKAVLNGPILNKTILVLVNASSNVL